MAMAEGIIDILSAGTHRCRFSLVVPAGSKERIARRRMALGFCLTTSLSTESHILQVILCSGSFNSMSGPDSDHASNRSLALDWLSTPSFTISVIAKGICPNAVSNLATSRSFSESGLGITTGFKTWVGFG